jgi:putative membrane-bound dehydrogenase-like protein
MDPREALGTRARRRVAALAGRWPNHSNPEAMNRSTCLILIALVCLGGRLAAQVPDAAAAGDDLPSVPEGFEVTIFARDPLVRNPCSLAFDARGRMFVGMGPQYRSPTPQTPPDSVVIVQDTDGDGAADKAHTFASGFNNIQSLAWHGRDLWVANSPDLTVVRDLDGDDVADEYVRVFTDLGNIEHGIHGLNWAPDGRLYMSKGNSKGLAIKAPVPGEPDRVAPRPFRELWGVPGPDGAPDFPPPKTFTREGYRKTYQDPRDDWGRMGGVLRCDDMGANLEIVARGFRNPYDIAFDHGFNWLGTDQDQNEGDRIIMPFFGANFGWAHAWSTHWTGENHLPTVPVSAPVFAGSGTGIVFADSPAWPERFRKVWIINDWLRKSTHIYRPAWDGALVQPAGGKWEDFATGRKALFRPVDMEFGADGALYILGWGSGYGVETDKDGEMTNEGRIFRIMPKGAVPLPPVLPTALERMTVPALVAEFDSLLPVRRSDAQDELVRRGQSAVAPLTAALKAGTLSTPAETWTAWTLARSPVGDGFFTGVAGNSKTSLNLRLQALRILGFRKSPALASVIEAALASPEPRVRFAAVQAVHQGRMPPLTERLIIHAASEKDRVTWYATWQALRDLAGPGKLRSLLKDNRAGVRCAALLGLLDLQAIPQAEVQDFTNDPDESVRNVAMLGMGRPTGVLSQGGPRAPARGFSLAANLTTASKREYAGGQLLIGERSYTDRAFVFKEVPDLLKGAFTIRTANNDDGSSGDRFLTFDLALDATVMVAHDTRLKELPAWLQKFADTDLTVTTEDTTFRLWSKDFPAGKVTLGGNCGELPRGAKSHYFVVIQPKPLAPRPAPATADESLALLATADSRRGEGLFFLTANCAACHRVGDHGSNFGPDLSNLGERMEAKFIVQSLLDPSAVITEGYSAHSVEAGGKSYFGMLLSTGRTLALGLGDGTSVELAADTITRHETLAVSAMPPQGTVLGPQDVADLTAWLLTQKGKPAEAGTPAAQPVAPVLTSSAPAPAAGLPAGDGFRFDLRADRLVIAYSGRPVADYVFNDATILRPFFANLHAPGGMNATRNFPPAMGDATDHADMHPGLWLGFGDLGGHDFWRNKGRIEHLKFLDPPAIKDGRLVFTTESRLLGRDHRVLGTLVSRIALSEAANTWTITWEAVFRAGERELIFGDQEEMGFGARVATPLTEKNGGIITNSTGLTTAANTWGQPATWCDYSGTLAGQPCGITLMASPINFRPSWWHNRDYGVFVANPFGRAAMKQGEKSAVTVKPGESFQLRFAAAIHSGPGYDPAAAFKAFTAAP